MWLLLQALVLAAAVTPATSWPHILCPTPCRYAENEPLLCITFLRAMVLAAAETPATSRPHTLSSSRCKNMHVLSSHGVEMMNFITY
jgi:hypothetical protein